MSKFVLIYCCIIFSAFAEGPKEERSVTPRDFSPKSRFEASKEFYKGMDEFSRGKFEKAYSSFSKVAKLSDIPVEEKDVAVYNSALSLERSKKYTKALDLYNSIANPDKDTYYRTSACCHELKKWSCVLSGLQNWKNKSGSLSLVEEFEFRVRTGSAYYSLQSFRDSVPYLETAVKAFVDKNNLLIEDSKNKSYSDDKIRALGLWALDDLASVYRSMGEDIELPSGDESTTFISSLKNQMELKAYYYLKSQDTYLQMINQGDLETASKGLFMIGSLYQDAYKSFMNSGTPKNIKDKKLEKEYKEELKVSLQPLIEKAKTAYSKNIDLANSHKLDNKWVDKSKAALNKIKN